MPFEKGKSGNETGRPPGKPNKTTEQLRTVIQTIIENNIETIVQDLQLLEPKERLNVINQLLRHVLPAPVNDLSQFSESDLDILITKLKAKHYEIENCKN